MLYVSCSYVHDVRFVVCGFRFVVCGLWFRFVYCGLCFVLSCVLCDACCGLCVVMRHVVLSCKMIPCSVR